MAGWRVVLVSTVPEAVAAIDAGLRAAGHVPVAVITRPRRGFPDLNEIMAAAPPDLDLLVPSSKPRLAPLLQACDPDLLLCLGFPWLLPPEALAVPRFGAANMHPSLLPRYRGPNPIGWAFRNDDAELGLTVHRMDESFDTGAILAQAAVPLEDDDHLANLAPKLEGIAGPLLLRALERIAAGDPGDPQDEEEASYAGLMEDEWAEIDWSRTAREVHNQVRSWTLPSATGLMGALTDIDGEQVRVLRTSLHPAVTGEGTPGAVVRREGERLLVQCGDRPLWVLETEQL
jgi:methionyl-tRNA formyltransferase